MRQRRGKGGSNVARKTSAASKKGVKIHNKFYPVESLNKNRVAATMNSQNGRNAQAFINIDESQVYESLEAFQIESIHDLIENSIQLYRQSGIYRRAVAYFGGMLTFDHYIYPWSLEENLTSSLSDFRNVAHGVKRYKIKKIMPEIIKRVLVQGTAYQYKLENTERIEFFDLPWRFCKVRGIENGVLRVIIDLSKIPEDEIINDDGEFLDIYPEEIQDAWVAHDEGTLDDEKLIDDDWLILSDEAFAITLDENVLIDGGVGIPYFLAAMLDGIRYERAKSTLDSDNAIDNAKIIDMKFKVNENGDNLMDEGTILTFVNMINAALPEGVHAVASPFDNAVLNLQGNVGATGRLSLADQHKLNYFRSISINPLIFGQEANSGEAMKLSVVIDHNILISTILPQIESYIEYELHRNFSQFGDWMIGFPPVTNTFRDRDRETEAAGLSNGTERLVYLATMGREPIQVANLMHFERDVLRIDEWMVPKMTSHTMSSNDEGGRPATDEPTASTEQTRDRK